jgi:hypothetical protein
MYRGRIWDSTQRLSFCVDYVSLLSFLLSAKIRLAGEKIVFPMALYYVEVVHRRRLRRMQPTSAHAQSAWFSFRKYRAASHRLPSHGAFART